MIEWPILYPFGASFCGVVGWRRRNAPKGPGTPGLRSDPARAALRCDDNQYLAVASINLTFVQGPGGAA